MHALQSHLFPATASVDNVILNAACVPRKDHTRWLAALPFKGQLYITSIIKTGNLKGARLLTRHRQLGNGAAAPYLDNALYIDSLQNIRERP